MPFLTHPGRGAAGGNPGRTPQPAPGTGQRRTRLGSSAPAFGGQPGQPAVGNAAPSARPGPSSYGPHGAQGAQAFLSQAATGYANTLLPQLQQGLGLARSRFGGGAINSGGAQSAEEEALARLFTNPLQSRIAQLAGLSLQHGEGQRLADRNFHEARRQFNREVELRESERRSRSRGGIGRFLGTLGGGALGFFLGGPAGLAAGAGIGGQAFGGD